MTAAEAVLLAEIGRPTSVEHWAKMASAFENRAAAWRALAAASEGEGHGHPSRAMALAAAADEQTAMRIRARLRGAR